MSKRVGLIGTVTRDLISSDSGMVREDLGGILYQVAALSGLKTNVSLYSNIGEDLTSKVDRILEKWPTVDTSCLREVSAPSNFVRLHYPEKGERVEILETVVPAIDSERVLNTLDGIELLVAVCNSGFDIQLEEWREIVRDSRCPVWFDVHSLVLAKELGQPRPYVPFPEWRAWIKDVTYIQANVMELSSLLGNPGRSLTQADFSQFSANAFELGVTGVFVTLGSDGVMVLTPGESKRLSFSGPIEVRDTTGCGDVFCAATVAKLVRDVDLFDAARFGVQLAARATEVNGVEETFSLSSRFA
jgi:sugar/nucleoside kinase (ribokinase family)